MTRILPEPITCPACDGCGYIVDSHREDDTCDICDGHGTSVLAAVMQAAGFEYTPYGWEGARDGRRVVVVDACDLSRCPASIYAEVEVLPDNASDGGERDDEIETGLALWQVAADGMEQGAETSPAYVERVAWSYLLHNGNRLAPAIRAAAEVAEMDPKEAPVLALLRRWAAECGIPA